jgi:hypothetical protein
MTLLAERITAFLEQRLAWEEQQQEVEAGAGLPGGTGGLEQQGIAGGSWGLGRSGNLDEKKATEVVEVMDAEDEAEQATGEPLADVGNTAGSKAAGSAKAVASIFKKQGVKAALGGSGGIQQGVKRKPDIGSAFGSSGGGGGNPFARKKVNK